MPPDLRERGGDGRVNSESVAGGFNAAPDVAEVPPRRRWPQARNRAILSLGVGGFLLHMLARPCPGLLSPTRVLR